jgi:predicted O-methyltransferase YrrM
MDSFKGIRTPPGMAPIVEATRALRFVFASDLRFGTLLRVLAASKPGGRLLELGTGTGVGTAWLLDGMDAAARLVSVDRDAKVQDAARKALGHDPRVGFVTGDATDYLAAQPAQSCDLLFADGGVGKLNGFEAALRVVKIGGYFIGDDLMPQLLQDAGRAAQVEAFRDMIRARTDIAVVEMEWSSGLVIAVRRV